LAGRVQSGVPAPTNLIVPPHRYVGESVILIGDDQGAA
jgi:ubiquinol-cytochrome c reductase iron-sulfur subunit